MKEDKYTILASPTTFIGGDVYFTGQIFLGDSLVEETEYEYLDPKKAKAEARDILKNIKKDIE